jgi:hypothetical protein
MYVSVESEAVVNWGGAVASCHKNGNKIDASDL